MRRPLIIDGHLHIGKIYNFYSGGHSVEQLITSMDRLEIRYGCVSALYAIGPDVPKGNEEIAAAVAAYPDRLIGMLGVNPHYPEEIQSQIERHMNSGYFKQFKLHPFLHGTQCDHPGYEPVYEYANQHGLSILIHTWGVQDVRLFASVAARYPNAIFIMGHTGGEIPAIMEAVQMVRKQQNIMLDISSSWNYSGMIEYMVDHAGSERVLFGSDAVYNSQSAALGRVIYAKISDQDKLNILGENMRRILGLSGGEPG
jgi:predicted TIM-barrel fold metal-dependent hydrolase